MSYMQWGPSLSIGIEVIDEQHKQIVEYINKLDSAILDNDNQAIRHVLDELVDYTMTHFAFEESLLQKGGYPHFDAHKQVHETFKKSITEYVEQFEQGEAVGRKLLSMLRVWLTNHIKRDDMDYGPWAMQAIGEKSPQQQSWLNKTLKSFFG